MLGEERGGALPGNVAAILVEAAALVAMEAMAGVLVHVDIDVRTLLLDRLDIGHRDAGILLAEMQLHRALRLLVGEGDDAAAVITDRRAQARQPRRAEEGDSAAHAE